MKTTLIIPDPVFLGLKRRAAERNETISALATEYLMQGLGRGARKAKRPFSLPSFKMGPPRIDIADRDALYGVLDAGRDARLYATKPKD